MDYIKAGCAFVAVLTFVLLVGFGIALATGLARLPLTNIDRIVTQHTLQYVQTHQKVVLDYLADYTVATDDAHKNAAALQLCSEAAFLDPSEYPIQAQSFISIHCR